MTVINKQKFLAELGKLLTFMDEADRLAALEMYSAMYDEAESEEALSQFFMSPTRQAVIIARAYDAGARKLQGLSKAVEVNTDEAKYVSAIENLRAEAVSRGIIVDRFAELEAEEPEVEEEAPAEDEDQISLFEMPEEPEAVNEPAEEPAPAAEEEPAAETAPAEEAEEAPVPAPEAPEIIRNEEQINAFIEQFHIEAENLVSGETPAPAEEAAPAAVEEPAAPAEPTPAPAAVEEPKAVEEPAVPAEKLIPEEETETGPVRMVRKPKVFLLLLYIIAAIPVTIVGFALLLVPTLLLLALAAISVTAGAGAMMSVFSGFAVLADILVVLGIALVVCAAALFLVWTFIWFTVDVLIGFVVGVFKLGGKWCYKEVPEA